MIVESLATQDRALLERAIEARAKTIYLGNHTMLARVLGDLLLYVDTRELVIAPTLLMNGFWEFWVTQAIARHVKPGMTCVDVGANVGYYTMLMAALASDGGRVHAFDILPTHCQLIARSAEVNGLRSTVRVTTAAVCDADGGEIPIQIPSGPDGFGHFGNAAITNPDARLPQGDSFGFALAVSVTLDCALDAEARVDLVKVDVEGAEPLVWRGSEAVRRKHNPVFCMEYEGWRKGYPEFLRELRETGYRVRFIDYTSQLAELPAEPDPERLYMLWLQREGAR